MITPVEQFPWPGNDMANKTPSTWLTTPLGNQTDLPFNRP